MESIKPEELYTDKDKQQEYPQIYEGDELLAVIISFPLSEEEETMEIETEETEPSINATEILAKGSVDLKVLKKKNPKEEDEELNKLREKLKTSDEGGNLREVDPVNPITTANLLYNTSLNKLASSEDLELSRGEIGVSIEDYDPSKDKEKSTKNRWREKPNQNTAVKPALTQESDNYKKDKLDKAKYTNFLGRTDQETPVRVMDFATPGKYVGLDDYFIKHTDTLQDDQQQYDTRNFGKGKMQPKQYSNFLYKSELLHIENLTKVADLNSKKPYLLQQLNKAKITGEEAEKVIKEVNSADPTGDKAVYTQWILKQYINGNFKGSEDVEKFKDILNTFTKLKNSKKIEPADLNQYDSYGELVQKIKETLDSTGGYTSNREEELTREREGIRLLDAQNGIELYVVDTPEAAAKEFRNTEWCVKDPRWFNQYAETDPNFYYFTKGEEPFLLLHKKDFRDVNDDSPSDEDLAEVAPFMIEHNLPQVGILLENRIITKEDGELFIKAVNKALKNPRTAYELLRDKIITKDDGEAYTKVLNKALEDSYYAYYLLENRIITKEEGELYTKVLDKALEDTYNAYDLLIKKVITKDDGEVYTKALDKALKNPRAAYGLLRDKIITKEDGELFIKAVNNVVEDGDYKTYLLEKGIITQEELDKYNNQEQPEVQEQEQGEEKSEVGEQQDNINKTQFLHITTLEKIAK